MKQFWVIKNNFNGIWSETVRLTKVLGKRFYTTIILLSLINCSSGFSEKQDLNVSEVPDLNVSEVPDLNVMSFNILYATAAPKNWEIGRRTLVTKTILQKNPDIIGLQEVMDLQHDDLVKDLAASYQLYTPSNKSYFGNSIAYRKTRFTEINKGRFTYSPTPDIPGTDFHNNDNSRYASWMTLKDNKTNKSIFVLSTHFYSPREQYEERHKSAQILMEKVSELAKGLPVIAMGDFNMFETSDAYATVATHETNPLTDTYRFLHPDNPNIEGTVHGDVTTYPAKTNSWRIDYIFSSHLNILESEILHTHFNQEYPSDHFPITARFTY